MSQEIKERQIPPTLTLTHFEEAISVSQTIATLHFEAKNNAKGSFICTMEEPKMEEGSKVQVYCMVENGYSPVDHKHFYYQVLQRCKVVTTIHPGDYHDVRSSFHLLERYIEEHSYEHISGFRVVVHKEKRKWVRNKFFQKSKEQFITEVQILLAEESW